MYRIILDEYQFTNNNGIVTIKRYGEEWRDCTGDNAILSLIHKIEELEEENLKLETEILMLR